MFSGTGVTTLTSTATSIGGNLVVNGGTLQAATAANANNPSATDLGNYATGLAEHHRQQWRGLAIHGRQRPRLGCRPIQRGAHAVW